MTTLVREQVRVHSTSPIEIFLSNTPAREIARMVKKFHDEGLRLEYQGRVGEIYEFLCPASDRNGHVGLIYRIKLGRERKDRPVTGWCSCTYPGLCKHLAAAYVEAKELQHYQTRFCICGAEFLLHEDFSNSLCFDCLTDPEVYPYKPKPSGQAPTRGHGHNNNCHWCGKRGEESQVLWLGPDDTRYYAHTSCEVKNRTSRQEVQNVQR